MLNEGEQRYSERATRTPLPPLERDSCCFGFIGLGSTPRKRKATKKTADVGKQEAVDRKQALAQAKVLLSIFEEYLPRYASSMDWVKTFLEQAAITLSNAQTAERAVKF